MAMLEKVSPSIPCGLGNALANNNSAFFFFGNSSQCVLENNSLSVAEILVKTELKSQQPLLALDLFAGLFTSCLLLAE